MARSKRSYKTKPRPKILHQFATATLTQHEYLGKQHFFYYRYKSFVSVIKTLESKTNCSILQIVFAAALAVASAGVLAPLASSTVVEGPSSSASVVGPDGSAIVSSNPAGRIVASDSVGVAAVGYSAPLVAAPAVAPLVSAYHAPVVSGYHGAVLGRSLVASPLTASGYPLLAPGSGLEGQWIPDINEKLYDDGSYHGEIY